MSAFHNDYNFVRSVTKEEFESKGISPADPNFTVISADDIASIERLLDLMPGTLPEVSESNVFEQYTCSCGHVVNFYDFVFTALVDAGHSKSFILHTLLGNKYILREKFLTRCSSC